jgi:hypothetical protein
MRFDDYIRDLEGRLDEDGRQTLEAFRRHYDAELIDLVREDGETLEELAVRVGRYRSALRLIAAPERPDGTFNRSDEACEQLATEALGEFADADAEADEGEELAHLAEQCLADPTPIDELIPVEDLARAHLAAENAPSASEVERRERLESLSKRDFSSLADTDEA